MRRGSWPPVHKDDQEEQTLLLRSATSHLDMVAADTPPCQQSLTDYGKRSRAFEGKTH